MSDAGVWFQPVIYRQTGAHLSVHRRKFAAVTWTGLQRSPAHRTDAVLADSHVCCGGTEAADIEAPQVIADRRATVSPAAFVCHQLCADHITHGQPVVRRVQFPNGVQDSTSAAFAQEARTRQGADVQLPADIQHDNHLECDRTAGARQAAATPALISELLTTAVSVPARALH